MVSVYCVVPGSALRFLVGSFLRCLAFPGFLAGSYGFWHVFAVPGRVIQFLAGVHGLKPNQGTDAQKHCNKKVSAETFSTVQTPPGRGTCLPLPAALPPP